MKQIVDRLDSLLGHRFLLVRQMRRRYDPQKHDTAAYGVMAVAVLAAVWIAAQFALPQPRLGPVAKQTATEPTSTGAFRK